MKLRITTPADTEIRTTGEFDAPRTRVWEASTRPELMQRWVGVHNGWVLAVCEVDLRVGGACRYLWRGPDGEGSVLASTMESGMSAGYETPERVLATLPSSSS